MAEEPAVSVLEKTSPVFPETGFGDPPEMRKAVIDQTSLVLQRSVEALDFDQAGQRLTVENWDRVRVDFESGRHEGAFQYEPGKLLAHNIYHVAKVVSLGSCVVATWYQQEKAALETRLATLAVDDKTGRDQVARELGTLQEASAGFLNGLIWHDHGNLLRTGEKGPAVANYPNHEERSVEDARHEGMGPLVRDFIRVTNLKYGGVFSQGEANGSSLVDLISDLPRLRSVIRENNAEEPWMRFESELAQKNPGLFFELARLAVACDNLAYAADPLAPLESLMLYQENVEVLPGEDSLVMSRGFGPVGHFLQGTYAEMVLGAFPDVIASASDFVAQESPLNWWDRGAGLGWQRRERLKQIRTEPKTDGRLHLEGALRYDQLVVLAREYGVYDRVEGKLMELQQSESTDLAGQIGRLGTEIIREMLTGLHFDTAEVTEGESSIARKQKKFVADLTGLALAEAANNNGTTELNLSVSPGAFAYEGGDFHNPKLLSPEDFLTGVREGIETYQRSSPGSEMAINVFWTIRQDRWEGQEAIRNPASAANQILEMHNLDLIQGVNLAGQENQRYQSFSPLMARLIQEKVPVSVYLGQEKVEPENVATVKKWLRLAQEKHPDRPGRVRLSAPVALVKDGAVWENLIESHSAQNPLVVELPFQIGTDLSLPRDLPWKKLLQDERVLVLFSSVSPMLEAGILPLAAQILEEEVPGFRADDLFKRQQRILT